MPNAMDELKQRRQDHLRIIAEQSRRHSEEQSINEAWEAAHAEQVERANAAVMGITQPLAAVDDAAQS